MEAKLFQTERHDKATKAFHNSANMPKNYHQHMEKISWIDHVRNEEVLLRVNEQRNIVREI